MPTQEDDPTRVVTSDDLEWIPFPAIPGAHLKVLVADEELRQVVFKFKFDPGTDLPSHTHGCHAIAYTISGEWAYEGLDLPTGAVAYEPVGSTHTPTSESGAELIVFLNSETDEFLINHMADGSDLVITMDLFKALEGASAAEAEAALSQLGG